MLRCPVQVLGMYPGPDIGHPGSDCSGVVVAGPGAGTPVFGLATGCLATHVLASVDTMVAMPGSVTFEQVGP